MITKERNNATFDMIREAEKISRSVVRKTDLIPASGSVFGESSRVFIKTENLQRTGSFKVRGAFYRLSKLSEAEKEQGVVCASAGNHAQGVALASKLLGVRATVVMPEGAPLSKIAATRAYGAEVITEGRNFDQALRRAKQMETERGLTFIHAFDDPAIIAGQGAIALEILEDMPDCETIVLPIGGGGLAGGVALAAKSIRPGVRVIGVEPETAASMLTSVTAGHVVPMDVHSLADGVSVGQVGELTLALCRDYLDEIVTVSEGEIAAAILSLLERTKMVAEGAGAVSLAAVMTGKTGDISKNTVAILSGGNIDINFLERIIDKGLVSTGRRAVLTAVVGDKAGQLAQLMDLIASLGVNVLSVSHNRLSRDITFGQTLVSIEAELRDAAHSRSLLTLLREHGYRAEMAR
jgi:threonine dehydratase